MSVTVHPLDHVAEFEHLFKAIRNLRINPPQADEFMLMIIGSGPAEGKLRKLLASFGLLQNVTIVPLLKPWRSILAAGDIFIQPRPNASFNPFLLEAMAVGSAVAACKGGVDDLIIEDKTAVVFNPNDEISIRGTLQRLLDRRDFARQLARGAQAYLRESHSVSSMISSILRLYREADS
jgi:glycosyltransferase involved in cell wall biosynthesis